MESKERQLSDEVAEVFSEFVRFYEEGNAVEKKESKKGWRKYAFLANTVALLIAISFVLFGKLFSQEFFASHPQLLMYVFVYIIFGLMIVLFSLWVEFKSMEGFLKDAPLDFLKAYPEVGRDEIKFLEGLSKYSVQSLTYAKLRYEQGYHDKGEVVGLLVGTLTKFGVLPALFALFLAAYKVADASSIYSYAAFSLVGIYFIAFKVSSAGIRFKRHSFLLGFHLEHMRENN